MLYIHRKSRERQLGFAERIMPVCRIISVAVLLLFMASIAAADPASSAARKGVKAFKGKKFGEAAESFQKAAELDPTSGLLQYDLGTSLAHAGEFEDAAKALDRSLNYEDQPARRDAYYNLGYSLVKKAMEEKPSPVPAIPGDPGAAPPADPKEKLSNLKKGMEAFRQAILADPTDAKAKVNYETTKAIIREIEKNQPPQSQSGDSKDEKNKNEKKDQEKKQDQKDGENKDGEKKDGEQDKKEGDQGKDGEKKEDQQKDSEGKDQQSDPKQGEKDKQGDKDKDGQDKKDDAKKQDEGMKPGATPTPADPKQQQGEGGEAEPAQQPQTPEQQDALRVLNALAKDNPEQFKKLFKFQGQGKSRRMERDW